MLFNPDNDDWETNVLTMTMIDTAARKQGGVRAELQNNITGGRRL